MSRACLLAWCSFGLACGAHQEAQTLDSIFADSSGELARALAPDLYEQAQAAWAEGDEARRRRSDRAVDDYRTEARLWLAAAVTEAERVQLDRARDELQREEERWAKQLARDQEASAVVASDISVLEARAVALREAERVARLREGQAAKEDASDAILTRARFNLALAVALGATEEQVRGLQERADELVRKRPRSAGVAEALLRDTEILMGDMRAKWPSPQPGSSTELVETARVTGFAADRTDSGVVIRSERFFASGGQVSAATVQRFQGLLGAFPHGPVACQIAVPELQSGVWSRRAARLVEHLQAEDSTRVSTSMMVTGTLGAGAVQCTFLAYRDP
jgi:hypothetical protein